MTESVLDTWRRYEYPILRAIAEGAIAQVAHWSVRSEEILEQVVPPGQAAERFNCERALVWLEEGRYIVGMTGSWGKPYPQAIMGITAERRRAVGMWPNNDSVTDELLAKLEERANDIAVSQPEKSRRLNEAVGFLPTCARDILVNVVSELVVKAAGVW
jgi:hypothetical protein